jgi:hypothetical protein
MGEARLTRRDVAVRLGISVSSVRRMEGVHLFPTQGADGVWRFDAAEIEYFASRRPHRVQRRKRSREQPGAAAAKVFRMIEGNMTLSEIVIAARQPPEVVRRMYEQWLVSLEEGEQARAAQSERDRARREQLEDERLRLQELKIFRS